MKIRGERVQQAAGTLSSLKPGDAFELNNELWIVTDERGDETYTNKCVRVSDGYLESVSDDAWVEVKECEVVVSE